MAKKITQEEQQRKERHWQAHLSAQKKSGLSRAAYCREHKLSYHAASYWSRKLTQPEQKQTNLVPVKISSHFLSTHAQTAGVGFKVILPSRIAIEIGNDFSPVALTRLMAVLERN